nr:MAG TPA: hypothetical protein [Bacteriophage sp.]
MRSEYQLLYNLAIYTLLITLIITRLLFCFFLPEFDLLVLF